MPTLAILTHELRSLYASWLVWIWLAATALLSFLLLATGWGQLESSVLISTLLFPFLVIPWFFVILMLGISPMTGTRLDSLADGILSRPVTRYEYLIASWMARVLVVLSVYLVVMLPFVAIAAFARRPVAASQVTWYGVTAAIGVVGLVQVFLVTVAYFAGTALRRPILAAVIVVFVWFPINGVLHTLSLEEFSPISLSQSLPTLLQSTWGPDDGKPEAEAVNVEAMSRQAAQFLSVLSGAGAPPAQPEGGFYERGDYHDLSIGRVVLGYSLPTIGLLALTFFLFCWRDL